MPEYIVNLWLDGYDTEEQMEKACDEFIYDQLNFTASSVRVKRSDYDALLARHNALVKAVRWERECEDVAHWRYEVWEMAEVGSGDCEIYTVAQCIRDEARAEVDRLLEEK